MTEIIDLSQEIYDGMAVYKSLPEVKISMHASHEQWDRIPNPTTTTPSVYILLGIWIVRIYCIEKLIKIEE